MKITRIAIIDVSVSMDSPFSNEFANEILARKTMRNNKFDAALDHLRFAIQKMPPSSDLIIIAFAESARVIYDGKKDNTSEIEDRILKLIPNGSSTNLAAAFELVLGLLETREHKIRPLDVITDGLSNVGDPVESARKLQEEYGVFIHIYLIDPTTEGKRIADEIVGHEGEGEVDPVTSASELRDIQKEKLAAEQRLISWINNIMDKYAKERERFFEMTSVKERPKITAAYPQIITPGEWNTMDVFIYLRYFTSLVKREIEKLQYRENVDYGNTSSEFPKSLPKGCPIKISINSKTIQSNPSELTIRWFEPYNRLSFRIGAFDKIPEESAASIDIDVFADDLLAASMRLPIAIVKGAKEGVNEISDTQWYDEIFASYSRKDSDIVKHLKERYLALGIHMFIDLDDLRSGIEVRPALFEKIESSDLFQLFWSKSAKKSKYVTTEWKHALKVSKAKGGKFIRPVYWEVPIPKVPKGLSEINFRRIDFVG